MNIDYLIIGQGISGTWLSYYFRKEKKSFILIDNKQENSPSRLAAGIINPVTGRRHVEVWLADQLLPFVLKEYNDIGTELSINAISQKNIIDFFPSAQMRLSFQQRVEENGNFVSLSKEENKFREYFNYDFGFGEIDPVYTVHAEKLLPAWKKVLQENDQLLEEDFEISELNIQKEKISYKTISASKIIFCDGVESAENSFFKNLPFAPNKGEALIVEIPDLPPSHIYKKGMILAPLSDKDTWWLGSNYAWDFDNEDPSEEFREKAETLLKNWIKLPFTIENHVCGIRPATLERRPFVGTHPQFPAVGILNGMGTKGFSLAPFFAKQLTDHLLTGTPVHPEADISRFARILSRNNS